MDFETRDTLERFDSLPGCALVKSKVVMALFATSDEGVRRGVAAGRIPRPVKIGARSNGWRVQELRDALAQLEAAPADEAAG